MREFGYYYSGPNCDGGAGPKKWEELGATGIGVLEVCAVRRCPPADDTKVVTDALAFAVEFAKSPPQWVFPEYKAGVEGFDVWIKALETGKADGFGMAYNTAVWNECRQSAHRFLREAKERIGGASAALFEEAVGHYATVAENLGAITEKFGFLPTGDEIKDAERVQFAIDKLGSARAAEAQGLETLAKIVKAL
jgi:hypothetical protein